jgi:hypothetical protein
MAEHPAIYRKCFMTQGRQVMHIEVIDAQKTAMIVVDMQKRLRGCGRGAGNAGGTGHGAHAR